MNYTPGPWDYKDVCPSNGFMVYRFNNFSGSFQQWAQDGTKAGNAKLIVKAPEMYELLIKLSKWQFDTMDPIFGELIYPVSKLLEEIKK